MKGTIKGLREENVRLDAAAMDLKTARHEAEEEKSVLAQKNAGLKRSIQWLEEQSSDLEQALQTVQSKSRTEVSSLSFFSQSVSSFWS